MSFAKREPMPDRFTELADYNNEAGKGVPQSPEMYERMKVLQADFDEWNRGQLRREGFEPFEGVPGAWVRPGQWSTEDEAGTS